MRIKDEIIARILTIQADADTAKQKIQAEANFKKKELQDILDLNEGWLLRETDQFQNKVNQVVSLLRQK